MKILALVGSPKSNGNTFKTVQLIGQWLSDMDPEVEIEIIQLGQSKLQTCKGCFICIERGEQLCPIHDDRQAIEEKINQADGVIFASPVYTYNVSWLMKNFLDRFAYRCHRPAFSGKKAMVITTTGAVGLGFVGQVLSFMIGTMGFITCARAGLTYAPAHERDERKIQKETEKLRQKTQQFLKALQNQQPTKPSFIKLLSFRMQQRAFAKAPRHFADYQFWHSQNWLEPDTRYYYPVKINPVKHAAVSLISRLMPGS